MANHKFPAKTLLNTFDAIQSSHDKELLAYPVYDASFWTWVIYTPIAQHNCALN
jgi:hypothetical protein